MGDENKIPPSKKRAADREISRENPGLDEEEDVPEEVSGTFKRASDEVLASRRIVKVRHQQTSSTSPAPSSNPFAGIRLVPLAPAEAATEAQADREKASAEEVDQKAETSVASERESELNEKGAENKEVEVVVESAAEKDKVVGAEKEAEVNSTGRNEAAENASESKQADEQGADDGSAEKTAEADSEEAGVDKLNNNDKKAKENPDTATQSAPLSSFQHLSSSQNAFTGLAGTGFGNSTFSFGSIPKDSSPAGSGFLFGSKTDQSSSPSFSFGTCSNGSTPLFSTAGTSAGTKGEGCGLPTMQEVPVETGEENEETVFSADAVLFEYLDDRWKERGKGEVKVNISSPEKEKARLVMRARGNYRLILNASLYPDMKLTNMDKKGITFACVNSATEGKKGLSTFALKFKDGSCVESFTAAVAAHKGKPTSVRKLPENSPKASDD